MQKQIAELERLARTIVAEFEEAASAQVEVDGADAVSADEILDKHTRPLAPSLSEMLREIRLALVQLDMARERAVYQQEIA